MTIKIKAVGLLLLLALVCPSARSENNKTDNGIEEKEKGFITNTFSLSAGKAMRADTYLTPMHYNGWVSGFGYEHVRGLKRHPLLWTLNTGLLFDRTQNPVGNAEMLGLQLNARWSMAYRWELNKVFEVGAGGSTWLNAGVLYLSRNGNNPAAANASWTVGATAYATACFKLGKMPVRALYTADLPLVGAMFAPDYGQLYYEIYMGENKGLFTAAYWGKYLRFNQRLSFDLKIGRKWMRLGYEFDIVSTKVRGIVTRRMNNMFVLGLTIGE